MAVKAEKKYVLTNRRSGKVLTANGNEAVQLTANGSDEQIWRAIPTEGTAVQLVNKATGLALCVLGETENGAAVVHVASGKVVDIKEISDADFAPAQIWEFVKGENQDWVAEEVEKEKKAPAKRAAKASK